MSETLPNSIGFTISAPINEFACNLLLPKHFLHKNLIDTIWKKKRKQVISKNKIISIKFKFEKSIYLILAIFIYA